MSMILRALLLFVFSFSSYADNDKLYIGLDADMSAVAKTGGIAIARGAEIAIREINQAGGLLGKELALLTKDHRGNPARGIDNIKAYAEQENLLAILGGVHTPVAIQELPAIHEHKLIYLGPWAAGTPLVNNGYTPNYVFRVSVRDEEAGKVFIKHAKKMGYQKVGLLLEQTAWGRSNEKSITESAAASDISITTIEWFNWGQKDFSKTLKRFPETDAQAIILVANAPSGIEIARTMANDPTLVNLPIISHWGISGGEFVSELGLSALNKLSISVLQTYNFLAPSNNEKNAYVIQQYASLFDDKVTAKTIPGAQGVAHAYDLIHLLALAVKKAGSVDSAKIRDALENLPAYMGLVKHYQPAFTANKHDALWSEDYMMSRFDEEGWLIPIDHNKP